MKYSLCPVVDIHDLEDGLNTKYSTHDFDELVNLLWEGEFINNDSYKRLPFKWNGTLIQDKIYDDYDESEKKYAKLVNLIYAYLYEIFPEFDAILVDVSW